MANKKKQLYQAIKLRSSVSYNEFVDLCRQIGLKAETGTRRLRPSEQNEIEKVEKNGTIIGYKVKDEYEVEFVNEEDIEFINPEFTYSKPLPDKVKFDDMDFKKLGDAVLEKELKLFI